MQVAESNPDRQNHNLWGVSLGIRIPDKPLDNSFEEQSLQTAVQTLSSCNNWSEEAIVSRKRGRLPARGKRQGDAHAGRRD